MSTVLVIDIGNTSTSMGLYRKGLVTKVSHFESRPWNKPRIESLLVGLHGVRGAMLASVVPAAETNWVTVLKKNIEGPVVRTRHTLELGVGLHYPQPETIGADRLCNACGGAHKYGTPLIVADFGTAVTFDVVTREHGYEGGVIAPGLPLMFSYLSDKTAKLPHLKPGPTRHAVGKSTEEAMQLGARWGYRGMVREILAGLMKDPRLRNATLVATGGYAGWVVRGLKPQMIVDPTLTLYGLGRMYELNEKP